jgi:hypothetical protein
MRLLKYLLLAVPLYGQVTCLATPESLASNVLGVKSVGIWDIACVQHGSRPVTLRIEEILIAMPELHRINPQRAQQVINRAYNSSIRSRLIRVLGYSDLAAGGISGGGFIAITVPIGAAISLAGMFLHRASDDLRAQQPDLNAFSQSGDEITLAAYGTPGYAVTLTVYASLVKGAKAIGPVVLQSAVVPATVSPASILSPDAWIEWVRPELFGVMS